MREICARFQTDKRFVAFLSEKYFQLETNAGQIFVLLCCCWVIFKISGYQNVLDLHVILRFLINFFSLERRCDGWFHWNWFRSLGVGVGDLQIGQTFGAASKISCRWAADQENLFISIQILMPALVATPQKSKILKVRFVEMQKYNEKGWMFARIKMIVVTLWLRESDEKQCKKRC